MNHGFIPGHESGLRIPKKDLRDFSYQKKFGAAPLHSLDFIVAPVLEMKAQGDTDFCVNFALASVREDTEKVKIAPEYGAAKTKQIEGDYLSFGADPKDALKAAIHYGSLEVGIYPFTVKDKDRNFLADWKNYPEYLDQVARIHRGKSFFKVDGWSDFFDSCRGVMQMQGASILTGMYWQPEWISAPGGIIPEKARLDEVNPHAVKICGQKTINGTLYLIIQNSYGEQVGDQGFFYFPRSIVNKFFFGYAVLDLNAEEVKKETWNLLQKIADFLIKLSEKLKSRQPIS